MSSSPVPTLPTLDPIELEPTELDLTELDLLVDLDSGMIGWGAP